MRKGLMIAMALAFSLGTTSVAFADPPHGRGHDRGKHHKHDRGDDRGRHHYQYRDHDRPRYVVREYREVYRPAPRYVDCGFDVDIIVNFPPRDVVVVRDYYAGWRPHPPGRYKRWRKGYVLPADVVYYDLPPDLVYRLEPVPRGYRYVRVGDDILKLAIGTGMIVDAIEGLGRRG